MFAAASTGQLELLELFEGISKDKTTERDLSHPFHAAYMLRDVSHDAKMAIRDVIVPYLRNLNCEEIRAGEMVHIAALNGHMPVVRYLEERSGSPINPPVGTGGTPLHIAASEGHLDVVQYYTGKLENPNPAIVADTDLQGKTPLHCAAQGGHLSIVRHIASLIEDKNPKDKCGGTPLHLAAMYGRIEVVKFLFQCVDDMHPVQLNGNVMKTPLEMALARGHREIVNFIELTDYFINDNEEHQSGKDPMFFAKCDTFTQLRRTAFHVAALKGDLEFFKLKIPKSQNKNPKDKFGVTPLHFAAQKGHLKIVEHLCQHIDKSINPSDDHGFTVLHYAAMEGHLNIVAFYTKQLRDPNPGVPSCLTGWDMHFLPYGENTGLTPFHLAAQHGHLQVVKHLCDLLEDKNPKDPFKYTPLHAAATFGHLEVVKYILPFLGDKNPRMGRIDFDSKIRNVFFETPLHAAAANGHLDIVKAFAEHIKEDINPKNTRFGFTPLHLAAEGGHLNVVSYYTNQLQNPNTGMISDDFRSVATPLHLAAKQGHLMIVKHLCSFLEDKNPKDDNGTTPLHSAASVEELKF